MFTQIALPYTYDALEPVIDTLTVETHYGKHHATYTKNFNDFAEKAGEKAQELAAQMKTLLEKNKEK